MNASANDRSRKAIESIRSALDFAETALQVLERNPNSNVAPISGMIRNAAAEASSLAAVFSNHKSEKVTEPAVGPLPGATLFPVVEGHDVADATIPHLDKFGRRWRTDPAVPISESITPDAIICLNDGKPFRSLRRHIEVAYGLTPDQYRAMWSLPNDYPMAAPNYSETKRLQAIEAGLGKDPKKFIKRTEPRRRKVT